MHSAPGEDHLEALGRTKVDSVKSHVKSPQRKQVLHQQMSALYQGSKVLANLEHCSELKDIDVQG